MADVELLDRQVLTEQEAQVLLLQVDGLSNKGISVALGISIKTVTTHIDKVYIKLGVAGSSLNRRSAAAKVAIRRGILRVPVALLGLVVLAGVMSQDHGVFLRIARGRCMSRNTFYMQTRG